MSVARTSECVWCLFRRPATRIATPRLRRSLHSTPVRRAQDDENIDETKGDNIVDIAEQGRKSQQTSIDQWKQHYDQRQVEAIRAATKLIGSRFDRGKNVVRADPWSVDYYDDFQKIDPVVDEPVRAPWENFDDEQRLMTDQEADANFQNFLESLPPSGSETKESTILRYMKFLDAQRVTVGKEEAENNIRSAMAPTIPTPPKAPVTVRADGKDSDPERPQASVEISPEFVRLMQMTGYTARQLSALRVKTLISHRVANQTRLGKIYKQYFLAVAGNGNGLLGIGEGSADEMSSARLQAQYRAIRSMQPIKRYENRTIFGTVNGKVSATELELYTRPPGMSIEFINNVG
jgi:small subunit ribosomal protein S5